MARERPRKREDEPRRPIFGWRVWLLPMFFWPLLLDVPVELIRGNSPRLLGALLGLGLSWYAASLMAQGKRRVAGDGVAVLRARDIGTLLRGYILVRRVALPR